MENESMKIERNTGLLKTGLRLTERLRLRKCKKQNPSMITKKNSVGA